MKNIKLLSIVLVLLSFTSGCLEETPEVTPTATMTPAEPTMTPTPVMTPEPTVVPTTPAVTPGKLTYATYIVWIDSDRGFAMIRAFRDTKYIPLSPRYDLLNITINVSDRVRWINDDPSDFPLAVISNEGLWSNRTAYLRWQYARFEYTFNKTGTYTFSIQGYPRFRNQRVTVNP